MSEPASEAVDPDRPQLQRRLQWLIGGRLVVATVLLGGLLLLGSADFASFTPSLLLTATAGTYAASAAFSIWLRRGGSLEWMAGAQIAWDVALVTVLVYASGGAGSVLSFLYGVTVLSASLLVGPQGARASAIAGFSLYALFGVGATTGLVPAPPDQVETAYRMSSEALVFAVLSNGLAILIVSVLSSNLAARLAAAGGRLQEAEQSVASLERLNDDIVRSITAGLVTTDLAGRIRTVNEAAASMLRAPAEAIIGTDLVAHIPVGISAGGQGHDSPRRNEGLATRPDGTEFPVGFTETPLFDANGEITGMLTIFQDLTEISSLREQAERAERLAALGRLAAGLAHEIRNPLSSISGSVQLVRDATELGEEDRRLLGIVIAEVERLDDLVSTMLHVGKPKRPVRVETNLSAIARSVCDVARQGPAAALEIEIECAVPEEPVIVRIDPDQVRQVLWNLVKNAVQASRSGGRVRVSAAYHSDGSAVVEVRDEGAGVGADQIDHLFDVYHSTRPHGVGLGLALVKQLVEGHRGTVGVESAPGEGATFRVSFPSVHSEPPLS